MPSGNCKKTFDLERRTAKKNDFLPFSSETSLAWKFVFLCSFLRNFPLTLEKIVFQQATGKRVGLKQKIRGRRGKSWPNVASRQLQSRKKYYKNIETLLAKQIIPSFETGR